MTNTVSVIIAAYNAENFIGRAISSALEQSRLPLEIIVIDDCSSDHTKQTVNAIAQLHPLVKLLTMPQNGGPSAARNAGIEAAKGDWLAILDADDAFAPNRLARLIPFGIQHHSDLIADDLAYYDAVADAIVGHGIDMPPPQNTVRLKDFLGHNLADGKAMDWGLLKPIFRREFLVKQNIHYDAGLSHGEDFKIVVDLLLNGAKFNLLPEPLYLYTQRHGSQSQRASGLSRTVVAYGKLKQAAEALSLDPRIAPDSDLVALLRRRADGLGRQDDAQYISRALRNGSYFGLVKRAMQDKNFLPLMCAQVGHAIRRRLQVFQ